VIFIATHQHLGEFVARISGELAQEEMTRDRPCVIVRGRCGSCSSRALRGSRRSTHRRGKGFFTALHAEQCAGFGAVALPDAGRPEVHRVFFRIAEFVGSEFEDIAFCQPWLVDPIDAPAVFAFG
jgi:hypothetical protein